MTDLEFLKRIVIAWDADQDEELDEAMTAAREHCGFVLVQDADAILGQVKARHADDVEAEDMDGS